MSRDWNQHYSDPAHVHLTADPMLIQAAEWLAPGRALDLACGPGRHALYLARLGWHVTAVDSSTVAIRLLREQAGGLDLDARVADLERGEFVIAPAAYDLVCDFFFLDRRLLAPLREGVRPGGLFAGAIPLWQEGCLESPRDPQFLLQSGELRTLFDGWKILFYSESCDAGRTRPTARILARRA